MMHLISYIRLLKLASIKTLFIFLIISVSIKAYGQDEVDSLIQHLAIENNVERKTEVFIKIAKKLERKAPQKALSYVDSAFLLLESATNKALQAKVYHLKGNINNRLQQYEQALTLYEEALHLSKEVDDKKLFAMTLKNMGFSYYYIGNWEKVIAHTLEALPFFEQTKDQHNLFLTYTTLASVYQRLLQLEKSLNYYEKCWEIAQASQNIRQQAMATSNMGIIYSDLKEYDKSIYYLKTSQKLTQKLGDTQNLGVVISNLASVYELQGDHENAHKYYQEAIQIHLDTKDDYTLINSKTSLSHLLLSEKKYNEAIQHAMDAYQLAFKLNAKSRLRNTSESLFKIYKAQGNFQKALQYHELLTVYKDSIINEEKTKAIAEMQTRYESEKKERENQLLKVEAQNSNAIIERQRIITLAISALLLITIAFAIYAYRAFLIRKKLSNALFTQKQKAEAYGVTIENQYKEIEALHETQSQWISNIAHELRTPLTLVLGPIHRILKNESITKEHKAARQDLMLADKNGKQLIHLVNEVLDITKLDASKLKLNPVTVDFVKQTRQVVAAFDSFAKQKQIKVELALVKQLLIRGDPNKLEKIIYNLLSNAFKFTPQGGNISLSLSQSNHQIHLMVKDTGMGISEEDLPHIFERYFQSKSPQKANQGGTGIGLALSLELAKMHGGTLTVDNLPEGGCCFTLILPAHLVITDDNMHSETAAIEIISEEEIRSQNWLISFQKQTGRDKPHLLLVEDNFDMREYIKSILEATYMITTAGNGQEALNFLDKSKHLPDLIISDIMMPIMDGKQLAYQVKAHPKYNKIPFIAVTAQFEEKEKLTVLRTGIDDYINKPFHPEELSIRIENLLTNLQERLQTLEEEGVTKQTAHQEEKKLSQEEQFIQQLEGIVQKKINDKTLSVLTLADGVSMSESTLRRNIKKATGFTPAQFIREIKLQKALSLLENKQLSTLSEVVYAVGFEHTGNFSKLFEKRFGKKPSTFL